MRGATAGTLLRADGLQHPALALLQHVFLAMEPGRQLAWLKQGWKWICVAIWVVVSLQCFMQCKSKKSPSIALGFGNYTQCNHHPFSSISNIKCLWYLSGSAGEPGKNK